ncbi:MAG: hypothetical protein ACFFD3_12955 [Candidatus Thorarchaeota archaeon]
MTQRTVRVCPKCGSSNLRAAASSVGGWLVPPTYYCSAEGCGYSGSVYVEVDIKELDHMRKAINGNEDPD